MNSIVEQYFEQVKAKYAAVRPKSHALHLEACKYLPGGDTRTATFFLPFPNFIERGEGAYMYDVDGHKLLDFQNNYTSLIHGHGHQPTVEAVQKQIALGSAYTAPFEKQIQLANLLVDRYPSIDLVRFCNSGRIQLGIHAICIHELNQPCISNRNYILRHRH